jgi:hypothetical protein
MKKIIVVIFVFLLSSCSNNELSCNDSEVKETLLSILEKDTLKKISYKSNENLYNLLASIEFVTTENKNDFSQQCLARIKYKYKSPQEYQSPLELDVKYIVQKNEMNKNSFIITLENPNVLLDIYSFQVAFIEKYIEKIEQENQIPPDIRGGRNNYSNLKKILVENGWIHSKDECKTISIFYGSYVQCTYLYFKDDKTLSFDVNLNSIDGNVQNLKLEEPLIIKYKPLIRK